MAPARVLAIDGSPTGGGRTLTVMRAVLAAAEGAGARTSVRSLAETAPGARGELLVDMSSADAFVIGSPIYRASFASPLKALLDSVPRGIWGETEAPLRGKAVVVVATGASLHHFLALNDFRNVLAGFFATHVVPPGLYVPREAREGFSDDDGSLTAPYNAQAALQGQALVELTIALHTSSALRQLMPQA
jgi:FMN reductase